MVFPYLWSSYIGRDEDHLILKKWKSKRMAADGSLHISWPNEVLKTDWRSKQSGVKWLFKSLSLAAIASRAFFLPLAPVADVILLIYSKVNRKKTFTLFRQWSNRTNMTITLFGKPPKMSHFWHLFKCIGILRLANFVPEDSNVEFWRENCDDFHSR